MESTAKTEESKTEEIPEPAHRELTLFCMVLRVPGSAFPVEVDAVETVGKLKEYIAEKKLYGFPADGMTLFLAKKGDGGAWLKDIDDTVTELEEGRVHSDVQRIIDGPKMMATRTITSVLSDNGMAAPQTGEVHVLVKLPESPETTATNAPATVPAELVKLALREVLDERDQQRSVYSISSCTLAKEAAFRRKLGFEYKTIDITEDVDDSVDPFRWQANVPESKREQRQEYIRYFKRNLRDVLYQGESTTRTRTSARRFYLEDTAGTTDLLDCDIPDTLLFGLRGTTDLMIVDKAANTSNTVFAGLRFVIEVKKNRGGLKEQWQMLLELVAADLKSERRCAPVGLLTNLNDYWYFLWFTPQKEIARFTLTCPANGFKAMRDLLSGSDIRSAEGFPMRIRFLNSPRLPKRVKVIDEDPPSGGDAATEMLERYDLMSDELSPDFLLARRMEYAFQMVRDMPIHSEMYS